MSYATHREGAVCVAKGEETTRHFLGRIPQNGYGDADEVSFAAITTTPDFLGSPSSRDEKMDAYYGRISRAEEDNKTEHKE